MTPAELFATARVARLATVTPAGAPHVVPICFAVEGDTIYTAVDAKPKRTTRLQRLRNIDANPAVSVLADHYDEDWTRVWWARADGSARVLGDDARAIALLAARYDQFEPAGAVIAVDVERWSGWAA